MAYLLGFLVFLAGILTYAFFPRNDPLEVDVHAEEGSVVTFVDQHQAAKDYMKQMVMWKATGADLHAISDDVPNLIANPMKPDHYDTDTSSTNIPVVGSFSSSVICLDSSGDIASCPQKTQYIMTYGWTPNWWTQKTNRRQLWLKAMLKRTHGSIHCGVMETVCGDGEESHYAINNGQRYSGYTEFTCSADGKKYQMIPDSIGDWLYEKKTDYEKEEETEADVLICLSPVENPYEGEPLFHWDSINNTGSGHGNGDIAPLIGAFDEPTPPKLKDNSGNTLNGQTYSITGIVRGALGSISLLNLNTSQAITQTCASGVCTLSAGDLSIADIPQEKPYIFTYTSTTKQQVLSVYYYKSDEVDSAKPVAFISEHTAGPALDELRTAANLKEGTDPPFLALRVYKNALTTKEARHNRLADKKRFGI